MKISIVTPCYNEEGNVEALYERVKKVMDQEASKRGTHFSYEHIFIDNASEDKTVELLKKISKKDAGVKIIVNSRNFGPMRSTFYGLTAATGDGVVLIACDLQDPPELISEFIQKWQDGFSVVFGIRKERSEQPWLKNLRKLYYRVLEKISEDPLYLDAGDFFIIDKKVLEELKKFKILNPYLRGMISKMGFPQTGIGYSMEKRVAGVSKANLYSLTLYALKGLINHSTLPLRLTLFSGFVLAFVSLGMAVIQLFLKIVFWDTSVPGIATLIIAIFFFSGVQLLILGILGEYILNIQQNTQGESLVVVSEKIGF